MEGTYYEVHPPQEGNPGTYQLEIHFNLYNKGLESLRHRELHLELDYTYIDILNSISVTSLSSKLDNEKLRFKKSQNRTNLFEFTMPELQGRQKKKLIVVLRTNNTEIF
jgi:hypothetical protein